MGKTGEDMCGAGSIRETYVPPSQFHCKAKTVHKKTFKNGGNNYFAVLLLRFNELQVKDRLNI